LLGRSLFPQFENKKAASEIDRYSVCVSDAVDFLFDLPPESMDCVVTDPAYESIERHRQYGTTTRLKNSRSSSNPWFKSFSNDRLPNLIRGIFYCLKHNTHAYIFCDYETLLHLDWIVLNLNGYRDLRKNFRKAKTGFRIWPPLVWRKTHYLGMGGRYRRNHEFILMLEKGKRQLNSRSISTVLDCPPVRNGYPAEKPVDLLKRIIELSTEEGDIVCDPFLGSGSTGAAALLAGRRFAGCDILETAIEGAERRLDGI